MTRQYTEARRDLTRTALVRDLTDSLRHRPDLRNVGLSVRREIAAAVVDSALSVERDQGGQG